VLNNADPACATGSEDKRNFFEFILDLSVKKPSAMFEISPTLNNAPLSPSSLVAAVLFHIIGQLLAHYTSAFAS